MENNTDYITDKPAIFDFKGFLLKVLSYWKLIIMSVGLCLGIAFYTNARKLPIYKLDTTISIENDQNPFFTSNTSLTFNWGGTSDKVNTAITVLRSRSHKEEVVERLQLYLNYWKDGKYRQENAYGQAPFKFQPDTSAFQALDLPFKLQFIDDRSFILSVGSSEEEVVAMSFGEKSLKPLHEFPKNFKKRFQFNEKISEPFLSGTFVTTAMEVDVEDNYYISFKHFDEVVESYQRVMVNPPVQGTSVLRLSLTGENKAEIADYLNSSVAVLSEDMLERKNLFATKTISFIDSSLASQSLSLKSLEGELDSFRSKNEVAEFSMETEKLSEKLLSMDVERSRLNRQLLYYKVLEEYLVKRSDYSTIPAPTVAGITEEQIFKGVQRLLELAAERRKYEFSMQKNSPVFLDIDRQINSVKAVLLENISSSQRLLAADLALIERDVQKAESSLRKLPQKERDLLKLQREYTLNEGNFNFFLEKRTEAGLVKAANVSDVMIIDPAKDAGDLQIGPNTQLTYALALMIGGILPLTFIFFRTMVNQRLQNAQEIAKHSPIPILGLIGKNHTKSPLAIFHYSRTAIAEDFRSLRSSLQYVLESQTKHGNKTVLITSSVPGEGKTFCAVNLATVLSLCEKKTLLIEADLRRPGVFQDFKTNKEPGLVDILSGRHMVEEVVQASGIPHLDLIVAGKIPVNPAELLISERMDSVMVQLRESYDYILIDTPPLGVVSDAFSLMQYADASLYVIRQDYTKSGMLETINERYKSGEVKNLKFVLNHFVYSTKYGYEPGYGNSYGRYVAGYREKVPVRGIRRFFLGNSRSR